MTIRQMFNITRWTRNVDVDVILLFGYLYLKNVDSPNNIKYRCYKHKFDSFPDTWGPLHKTFTGKKNSGQIWKLR